MNSDQVFENFLQHSVPENTQDRATRPGTYHENWLHFTLHATFPELGTHNTITPDEIPWRTRAIDLAEVPNHIDRSDRTPQEQC
jgi:hypothetical protein